MINIMMSKEIRPEIILCKNLDLEAIYNDYINSLKAFWKAFDIEPYFIKVSELSTHEWGDVNDPFIKDGISALSKSIQENGTYFPIVTSTTITDVCEGTHRVLALNSENVDMDLLCYNYMQGLRTAINNDMCEVYLIWPSNRVKELISMRSKFMKIERVKENYYKITSKFFADIYNALLISSVFISELVYGNTLVPAKCINDKSEFNKWVSG